MSMDAGYSESGEYNRPRRPNPDTISYLRSLPLDIQVSSDEVSSFLEDKAEYPQSFSAAISAIDEIRNEVASLAGDEFGSQCIETLARITAPYSALAARTLLCGLAGYHVHLATHRYGSHVVQTIVQLAVTPAIYGDLATHEDSPQIPDQAELPLLPELILDVVKEVSPFAHQLAVHVCGSHVLRTLLCVLGGVELVQSPGGTDSTSLMESGALRRGRLKNKKKKKKKKPDTGEHARLNSSAMHMVFQPKSRLDEASKRSLSDALQTLSESLWSSSTAAEGPGELQQMACHPSAGPLLMVLLRVLTYASCPRKDRQSDQLSDNHRITDHRLGIHPSEPTFQINSSAQDLTERLLCWQRTEPASKQKYAGDIIYGLSGEPRGSHVLETLFHVIHDDVYGNILQCGDFNSPSALQDYVEHNVSNFVIQTLLSTVRTRDQAGILLKSLERLVSNGYVLDPLKKRRGVLWRAAEMAATHRVGQDTLLKVIRLGFATLDEKSVAEDNSTDADDAWKTKGEHESGKTKKKRIKASSISMQECVMRLMDLKTPESDGGRITVDVAGARTLYHLLRFVPRLCGEILDGIMKSLSQSDMELIAKDGLGSRCIMDGIFDSPGKKEAVFEKAYKDILKKLNGRWVALSVDRVGHHMVKKMFRSLVDVDDKAVLAAELAQGINRLSGNAMGRSVMDGCCVREFAEGENAWRDAVRKQIARQEWLNDIGETADKPSAGKTKRKRKRQKRRATEDSEKGDEEDDQDTKKASSTVASIMDVLSVKTTEKVA